MASDVNIQGYLQLLTVAYAIGDAIYTDVKAAVNKHATPDELAEVQTQWDDNVRRSAADMQPPSD